MFFQPVLFGQSNNDQVQEQIDSLKENPLNVFLKLALEEEKGNSVQSFKNTKIAIKQDETIAEIGKVLREAQEYLIKGIDTVAIKDEYGKIEQYLGIAEDGVFKQKGEIQTYRNLVTSNKIMRELFNKATARKLQLEDYKKNLYAYQFQLDSLFADSSIYILPADTSLVDKYFQKLILFSAEADPVNKGFNNAFSTVQELINNNNLLLYKLKGYLEQIDKYEERLSSHFWDKEMDSFGSADSSRLSFSQIQQFSINKGKLSLRFYIKENLSKIFVLILLIIAGTFFLYFLKGHLKSEKLLLPDFTGQLVFRYPLLSSLVIFPSLLQFLFADPPFIFAFIFWMISAVSLTFIFWHYISKAWMAFWLIMLSLFFLGGFDNLILQSSGAERWAMLVVAISGIVCGLYFLLSHHKDNLREKLILYFISLEVLLELGSVISNLLGRYNLSKILLNTGFCGVIIGITFLWTVRLLNEVLSLASKVYSTQKRNLFYINFQNVGEKVNPLFYVFLVLGWFILIGRNFYIFNAIARPINDFIVSERTIGDYTFSINKILLFFLIMGLSIITSKVVSYFASDRHVDPKSDPSSHKEGLGSWILVIRIFIISTGLFFAIASTGIPMDRITIILGALGVGIGLGLQVLVNNLVSGLIIAFERPVKVGDFIELNGQSGTMKSIGFRSSIISRSIGADLVIPNGDLLNAHLINWTKSSSNKMIPVFVDVAYGTDLARAKQIILDILKADERVQENSNVFVKQFKDSGVELQVSVWVKDYKNGFSVQSDTMLAIENTFKNNGIEIPFPQQELRILPNPSDTNPGQNA